MNFSAHSIDCGCIGVLVDILRVSLLSFLYFHERSDCRSYDYEKYV